MRPAGRGTADHERDGESLTLHFLRNMDHLVERWRDEAGEADDVAIFFLRGGEDFFARNHHSHVDDFVIVAGQNDANDVFADIVDIAFHRGHENAALRAGIRIRSALGFHERGEPSDGFFHHTGAFHHLRQEHFPFAEEVTDDFHAVHERAFDDREWLAVFVQSLLGVGIDVIHDAFDERMLQALLHGEFAPGRVLHGCRTRAASFRGFEILGKCDEPLSGISAAVQENILDEFEEILRDVFVDAELTCIHDAHVQAGLDCVVEKGRVHGLADRIVATEGKRDVADTAAHACVGEVFLDPSRGIDECVGVIVVLLDAGGDGEDVRIKNDVLRREAHLIDKHAIGAFANLDFALEAVGLSLLVEGHDDRRSSVSADETGLFFKFFRPFLEADRVDDALALDAAQARFEHFPL